MRKELIVDLQVTGRCNMDCDFCCGAIKDSQEQDFTTIISVINQLKAAGASAIVFSGGEPLLREDIADLIKYTHDKGLITYLSTNGLLFFEKYKQIKNSINYLGLPLDSSSEDISVKMGRNHGMFYNNLNILRYFVKNPPNHKVKVGTLISKVNSQEILSIGELLSKDEIYQPDVWRLYQFTPIRRGLLSREKHEISDLDFMEVCTKVKKRYSHLNISELSNSDSDSSYFFIDPKMHLQILVGNDFLDKGDLRNLSAQRLSNLLQQYSKTIDKSLENRGWLYGK